MIPNPAIPARKYTTYEQVKGVEPASRTKTLLPTLKSVLRGPRWLWHQVGLCAARVGVRNSCWASAYYLFFSRAFRREHLAVLAGHAKYSHYLRTASQNSPLLRRNVHRLEKGLLMVPRRDLFGLEYINETVDCFARCVQASPDVAPDPESEQRWARDVLRQYFDVTPKDPRTAAAREQFERIERRWTCSVPQLVPYRRQVDTRPTVCVEDLLALARRRRSVRWFLPKAVPRQAIDKAMEVAAQSPSACNRQPFVFRVFDDPSLVRQVAEIPMGTTGYDHNIPVITVVVGQLRNYFSERDRHLIYIDASLAAMAFAYALETQGLSTCMINWPDMEDREQRLAALLNLEPDERPVMCMALGYPDPEGLVAYSQKKPLGQLRRYNLE
jgi:nitroreductase